MAEKSTKKMDLGSTLRASVERRREIGSVVEEDGIPGAEGTTAGERMIDVDLIDTSPYQPRLSINEERVESLAESIRETGSLLQPIVVRPKEDGRYELVFGERRWRAFKLKGYKQIPANIRHLDNTEAFKAAAAENLQRENLEPFEIALMLRALKEHKVSENNTDLARLTGINRVGVQRYLLYFKLPQQALDILQKHPSAIGANVAEDLAHLCEQGHEDLVYQVVSLVADGRLLQGRAVQWIKDRLSHKTGPDERKQIERPDGNHFATLTMTKNRLSISLDANADTTEVRRLIVDVLEKHAQQQTAKQE